VYAYSKLFNHLAQYALEQVNTDEKKYHFMNGLSTKLQEHLALNAAATHPTNQVQWAEFREAFRVQHIPASIMRSKH
jgi:hypothetical protein